jgi:methionyl-tRNA synthetase
LWPASETPATTRAEPGAAGQATIDISDFQKVDLRTARVLEAERVPGSDKLIRLTVALDAGGAVRRQIVAGIGRRCAPEQLIGKMVVIVANLKPRKVFNVESQGMLLAAGDETTLTLLTTDGEISPGVSIK